ncbi:hypothetical protein Zmor_007583 [Zophobas morio]|uniref:Uncharacterized protein n=1 Tax=Zophobas morio TaxID=2755281 RepID=A0AA38IVS1_9CUCU|nr:hypothetical protein Zmor_007583 [Zophobas morio]
MGASPSKQQQSRKFNFLWKTRNKKPLHKSKICKLPNVTRSRLAARQTNPEFDAANELRKRTTTSRFFLFLFNFSTVVVLTRPPPCSRGRIQMRPFWPMLAGQTCDMWLVLLWSLYEQPD